MEKDPRLINIYLKIHNKRCITMDDLQYLAIYSPECFEKTCKNVVYNFPNAKNIMEPENEKAKNNASEKDREQQSKVSFEPVAADYDKIREILKNLNNLEQNELPQTGVTADEVKELLGNLYMEMIFPHDDKIATLFMPETVTSSFDFKV